MRPVGTWPCRKRPCRTARSHRANGGEGVQIGIVTLGFGPPQSPLWRSCIDALRELGYVEGRNLVIRMALAEGEPHRLPGLVAGLLRAKVDLIATTSIDETLAAKRATSTIPIVMTLAPTR